MAKLVCQIGEYSKAEAIIDYLDRFEQFLYVNDIKDDKQKVGLLLTLIGAETYAVLKHLCLPKVPSDHVFTELSKLLRTYYSPQKLVVVERFKFYKATQKAGESIAKFTIRLKEIARDCDFNAFLDDALRDRLIGGISDERIQKRLLCEAASKLTFDKAYALAIGMELASGQSEFLHGGFQPVAVTGPQTPVAEGVHKLTGPKKEDRKGQGSPTVTRAVQSQHTMASSCTRCGRAHNQSDCPVKNWKCFKCDKVGHVASCCRAKTRIKSNNKKVEDDAHAVQFLDQVRSVASQPNLVTLNVNKVPVEFELDTGASSTVVDESVWKLIRKNNKLLESSNILKSVSGATIPTLGEAMVEVNGKVLKLVVVSINLRFPLLGRTWLDVLYPNWRNGFEQISQCTTSQGEEFVTKLKLKFPNVFRSDGSVVKDFKANINLKEGAVPVFHKPYKVPYAIKDKVSEEIDRLVSKGVLVPVKHSSWASPVVPIVKPNGDIRLCCDYKRTVNPNVLLDVYPIPTIEDIFAQIHEAKVFTIIDLSNAYLQCEVSEESREMLTINTNQGLFKVTKLPFGINCAPMVFQCLIDQILQGLDGVSAFYDDILIHAVDSETNMQRTWRVFERLSEKNIKVNLSKCQIFKTSVIYLGHKLCAEGIFPVTDECEAILKIPVPRDESALKSFLGLINYYHKFLPHASTVLKPLHELANSKGWEWTQKCDIAFSQIKKLLVSSPGLTYYNPSKPIILTTDSSSYGCGAVMSHVIDGIERPVMFISNTFSDAQKRYSQTEKEALAVVTAVRRLHKFLFGRKFVIRCDHKALQYIFSPNKGIPEMTAAKLQRWAIFMSAYNYDWQFKAGKDIPQADGLSRNPLPDFPFEEEVFQFSLVNDLPITAKEIAIATKTDNVLSKVKSFVLNGWPSRITDVELSMYFKIRLELTFERGCIIRGMDRVVVPKSLQPTIMGVLHEGHPGVVRMKHLARSNVWWPGLDKEIESKVGNCVSCQVNRPAQPVKVKTIWPPAGRFWERIHIDFFEKCQTKFLVLVDSFSGWIEVWPMYRTNAEAVIQKLRTCFSVFSLPKIVVSDNGPPFNSQEYSQFLEKNGVLNVHSPPYHPKSNGQAERLVGVVKAMLSRELYDDKFKGLTLQHKLDNILFAYRTTPRANGVAPYASVFKFSARTKLSLLKPQVGSNPNQEIPFSVPVFQVAEQVWVKNSGSVSYSWVPGVITKQISPTTYLIEVQGRVRFFHVDSIRKYSIENDLENLVLPGQLVEPSVTVQCSDGSEKSDANQVNVPVSEDVLPCVSPSATGTPFIRQNRTDIKSDVSLTGVPLSTDVLPSAPSPDSGTPLRRSKRTIKKPERLDL